MKKNLYKIVNPGSGFLSNSKKSIPLNMIYSLILAKKSFLNQYFLFSVAE